MNHRFLSTMLGLGLGLGLVSTLPAQGQVVCFSFDGVKTISGRDNLSGKSKTGVRVGGKNVFIATGAGDSPATCADKLHKALTKAGFKAKKAAKNVVCVEAGPGGAPLTTGGGIGTTDTGLQGIDVSVMKPPAPKAPKPKKPVKGQGATIPQVKPGKKASKAGWIEVEIEVEVDINGKKTIVKFKIRVNIKRGQTSNDINKRLFDLLRRFGFLPRLCFVPHTFNRGQMIPSWNLEHHNGNPVRHVTYLHDAPTELIQMHLTGGSMEIFGATNYGDGATGNGAPAPFMDSDGSTNLGQRLVVSSERNLPHCPMALLISPRLAFTRADFLVPGGHLLVDANAAVMLRGTADRNGSYRIWGQVPRNRSLVGQNIYVQSACFAPKYTGLSDGLQCRFGQ